MIVTTSSCDYDALLAATGCGESDFLGYLGASSLAEAKSEVRELCDDAFVASEIFPFEKVTNKGRQFDLEFFNGGGEYNNIEKQGQTLGDQTVRLKAVADNVLSSKIISWPHDMPSFNLTESCSAQAVTCCWTNDKYDVGDGSCNSPTGCIDKEPLDNTDVCSVDMSKSRRASRVYEGVAFYPGNAEGDVNCHGFAWGEEDEMFKGNALFHVAMQKGLMENGYVHNVPGAPMCGCVENMPVISKAGCSKTISAQTWDISLDANNKLQLHLDNLQISFEDCGEDLADHYVNRFSGEQNALSSFITGECDDDKPAAPAGYRRATSRR